ncbi:MAG: hypothetical protein AAF639_31380 [Chloroflexota bacterium]
MAYSDFTTIKSVQDKFPITVSSTRSLFANVEEVPPSALLQEILAENIPVALNISTEKARSELIIAPILMEVRKLADRKVSLFSGVDFTVDTALGLSGYCDYILSGSPDQMFITAPIVCMVEAKNERMGSAYGQCLAEMIAAQRFHQLQDKQNTEHVPIVWGVATTGAAWRFLQLEGNDAFIDFDEYLISQINQILGIFRQITINSLR